MLDRGDDAPTFTAPMANGDIEPFDLAEALQDGPVVLAFFPGAFTSTCTTELCTFRDRLGAFESVDATVVGISADTPFALNAFRADQGLQFGLVSDVSGDIAAAYGVASDLTDLTVPGIAPGDMTIPRRSVFVVDSSGTVTYAWAGETPKVEPDYDDVEAAAVDAA
jgi:peroxiredoxin